MTIRLFVDDAPLVAGQQRALPATVARHAQVRRVQPGDSLVLFDGRGAEWPARILSMGRSEVIVRVGECETVDRELPFEVTLAVGAPANERMDLLVEKATELGVGVIQPLCCERSVLRLAGERAERKREHWQGVAVAACEQSGRTRLPRIAAMLPLAAWLQQQGSVDAERWLLSPGAERRLQRPPSQRPVIVLSGPEGGLSADEQAAAQRAGFAAVQIGPRVLRAETAPLAVLSWLGLQP